MTDQVPQPAVAGYTLADFIPVARNILTYAAGVATAIGVMKSTDQATLIDAITHMSGDVQDFVKYAGVVLGITMPIWVHVSSSIAGIIKSLKRKSPETIVVAPPAIAAVTSAESNKEVVVVSKVSGQEIRA